MKNNTVNINNNNNNKINIRKNYYHPEIINILFYLRVIVIRWKTAQEKKKKRFI